MNQLERFFSLGRLADHVRGVAAVGGLPRCLVRTGDDGMIDPSLIRGGSGGGVTPAEARAIATEVANSAVYESEERARELYAPKVVAIDDSNDEDSERLVQLADLAVETYFALISHENDVSNPHDVTKEQVGLGNVDNTSDMDKPVSTATMAEIEKVSKALLNNPNPTIGEIAAVLGWEDN